MPEIYTNAGDFGRSVNIQGSPTDNTGQIASTIINQENPETLKLLFQAGKEVGVSEEKRRAAEAKAEELAAKLATVARGVSTRTAVLVLGGIQLRAEAGRLHLAATDMEVSLRGSISAQVESEGSVVVPGRLLLDIARSLPDSDVSIEHRPEEAVVVLPPVSHIASATPIALDVFPPRPAFAGAAPGEWPVAVDGGAAQ